MTTTRPLLPLALVVLALSACTSWPQVVRGQDVIDMKNGGADDAMLMEWVNDPMRTFDLSEADIVELVTAGIGEQVINVMLAKSLESDMSQVAHITFQGLVHNRFPKGGNHAFIIVSVVPHGPEPGVLWLWG